jgi:Tfp pilus assembly protein PilF
MHAMEEYPEATLPFTYAALFHSRLGKFSEAETMMKRAIQLDSTSAEVFYHSANMYCIQRNKQKAFASLEQALQLQYNFAEVFSPDLSYIRNDPEFIQTISRKIDGLWPK